MVHTKGFGSSFHASIQASTSVSSSLTLWWVDRRSLRLVNSPNQRSTRFSQDPLVGVKCRRNRGWAASHCLIAGVVWVP